jgi:hypothetical protein
VKLPSDGDIRTRLTAILDSPEFQAPADPAWWSALKKVWNGLLAFLDDLPPAGRWAIFALALVMLGGLVYYVTLTFQRILREAPDLRSGTADDPTLARALTCEELLADARRLKADGQLREAARALQQARLLLECRRQSVTWRSTLADWEWIAELGRPADLVDFTRATQKVAFGAEPSAPALEACEARLVAELQEPNAGRTEDRRA